MKKETIFKGQRLLRNIRHCEEVDADLKTIRSKDWSKPYSDIRVTLSTPTVGEIPETTVMLKGDDINDIVQYLINRNAEQLKELTEEFEKL